MRKFPWWFKVFTKLVMGLTPFPYEKIRKFFTKKHGEMESPEYAQAIFQKFYNQFLYYSVSLHGGTFLELGPGGSLLTGFFAKAQGFKKCILIDVGDFASPEKKLYLSLSYLLPSVDREIFINLLDEGVPVVLALKSIDIHYYTSGIESLKKIPCDSIDFSFSNAVLEHVKKNEFKELLEALFKVHKCGSISSHEVDFKDHLGGGLNNLRFSDKVWESKYFTNDGFYTNRLRHSQVIGYAVQSGFKMLSDHFTSWDSLPKYHDSFAREFRLFDENDIRIKEAVITLQKPLN